MGMECYSMSGRHSWKGTHGIVLTNLSGSGDVMHKTRTCVICGAVQLRTPDKDERVVATWSLEQFNDLARKA